MQPIILASKSPRRKELMSLIPTSFIIQTKEIEEWIDIKCSPVENVKRLAYEKAKAIGEVYEDDWILGCDTIVVYEQEILGKPKDEKDARDMLSKLSGKAHLVYTGIALYNKSQQKLIQEVVCSKVYMKNLSQEELDWYLATGESLDKAGSYGIQGFGSNFIEKIEGDYFNIVGLPVGTVYKLLKEEGLLNYHL